MTEDWRDPTDRYDLPEQAVLHGLNKDLEVCRTPDAGSKRFTINADHGVYFLYLDAGRQWLCVETENGVTGWLKLADYTAEEAWATFNDLIPNGGREQFILDTLEKNEKSFVTL